MAQRNAKILFPIAVLLQTMNIVVLVEPENDVEILKVDPNSEKSHE